MGDALRCYRPVRAPSARLICFPHGGSGPAFYRTWADLVPPDVEISVAAYPGRQERLAEPPATTVDRLVEPVVAELRDVGPVALFGHSMGAVVAYEVAHRLVETGRTPVALFVSAHRPPHRLGERTERPDAELAALLRHLGGVDPVLLDDPELVDLVLDPLRTDHRLMTRYQPTRRGPLPVPVVGYAGADDPLVDPADLAGWADLTSAGACVRVWPGDHFYLVPQAARLLADMTARLRADEEVIA
ncbi:thioesterase II family protein [Saccharothrix obliqua]|uniref:thioesterase II family protein n=1 Tax=Saccharothrix obliqua TaxID=2861747 RepID=UPI001C5D35B8|nr:alpha/beta fold hydrolase [Saccharothrix obliqua]MBW4717832.1 alpha/beta fold hydrolase [Saccharothrix obliqua]